MAGGDDEFEKLLREVDGALGSGAVSRAPAPGAVEPRRAGFFQSALPQATAVGAAWGVGTGGVFLVLPFVHSLSGAVAAFVTAFSMSILGRWRRR
jgi:hypothetical protein